MIDGRDIDVDTDKGPTLGFHGLVSMIGTKSNNALTFSIDSSMLKFFFQNRPSISPRGLHNKTLRRCD